MMIERLSFLAYEKINNLLERILPEEKRNKEKRQELKKYGMSCFFLGYQFANQVKQEEIEAENN